MSTPFVETAMVTSVPATMKKVERSCPQDIGSSLSSVYTSREKRFTMRPMGVESKKKAGAERMRPSSRLCRVREALMRPSAMKNPRTAESATLAMPRPT